MKAKKTSQILSLLALALLSSCGAKGTSSADSGVPDGYTLEWSDEFDGTELDKANWTPLVGGGGWGNNELEYYQAANATVADGLLTIAAKKESMHIEKSKPWDGEKFLKGYPNEPHEELLKLFVKKRKTLIVK